MSSYTFSKMDGILHIFQNGWNNHKIRTARNKTPIQLWINGIIERYGDIPLITDSIEEVSLTHAVLYVLLVIIIVKLLYFASCISCCILPNEVHNVYRNGVMV